MDRYAWILLALIGSLLAVGCDGGRSGGPRGTADEPIRVMLVPAFGGTEAGTKANFKPLFDAVSRSADLRFDIKVGSSYSAVIEAMANNQVDIAFLGPYSYMSARKRGAAEILAVAVKGESVYYAGVYVAADSDIKALTDLKGKRVAFGDQESTSSFNYPVAMMLTAGVNPATDLAKVVITDSHASSLAQLSKGNVDACCAAVFNFEKAANAGQVDRNKVRLLAKSQGIPNSPLAMNPKLPAELKKKLKDAFGSVHNHPDIKPEMVRGEGGKVFDRYDAEFSEQKFVDAMKPLDAVTDDLKQVMLRKSQE